MDYFFKLDWRLFIFFLIGIFGFEIEGSAATLSEPLLRSSSQSIKELNPPFQKSLKKILSDTIQKPSLKRTHSWEVSEKGIFLGYGYGINRNNLPEGNYMPIFLIHRIGITFPRLNRVLSSRFQVSLIAEPQINLVLLRDRAPNHLEYEFGLGLGIQNRYLLSSQFSVYYHLIVGPQYFSTKTIRQTQGLIFSDNLGLGITYMTLKKWAISSEFRIRHMSNANLALPNYGINTNHFLIGISRILR